MGLLSGCAKNEAKQSLDADIQAQIVSTNPCSSMDACKQSFAQALGRFKQNGKTDFCDELVQRPIGDIATCEVQIRDSNYAELLRSCQQTIDQRLAQLEKERNEGLKLHADVESNRPMDLGFTIPSEVEVRDTSKGYYTVDADLKPKKILLSFDDGPHPTNTASVLRTLKEVGVHAHFFELGQQVQAYPDMSKLVASEGHSVGNHSWNHPNMQKISFEQAVAQIKQTHSIILKVLGWVDPFFRFPYGNRTKPVDKELADNEMADFYWTIDTNDWRMTNPDGSVRTNLQVINDTIGQLDRKQHGIILMHDIHRRTAELLPELLRQISLRGYTVVMLQPADQGLKTNPPILH